MYLVFHFSVLFSLFLAEMQPPRTPVQLGSIVFLSDMASTQNQLFSVPSGMDNLLEGDKSFVVALKNTNQFLEFTALDDDGTLMYI